jgi:ubiquinone biosynthesis protein
MMPAVTRRQRRIRLLFFAVTRLLITFLAFTLTLAITPWVSLHVDRPGLGPLLGAIALTSLGLVLVRTFVKPVITFLLARLLFWSFGLVTLVIDTALLVVVAGLAPGYYEIWDPPLLWIFVTSAILSIVLYVADGIFGFGTPFVEDAQSSSWYWQLLGRLSVGGRNTVVENLRLLQTLQIAGRYLTQITMDRTPFAGLRARMQRRLYPERTVLTTENLPATFRLLLQDLGPTYVKIGQMLSSRAEALPPEWASELERLQNTVDPFPWPEVVRIVTEELGESPETLFASFDPQPMAAASTAQVHRAVTHQGDQVAVKVQRPDIDVTVKADLNIMKDLLRQLERRRADIRALGLSNFLGEFAENVLRELDYRNEAYNMRRLAASMERYPFAHVPELYPDLSSRRVLTMEFITGVKLSDAEAIDAAGIDRNALADGLTRAIVKQVMFDGFFHGDPHPGNIWFEPATGRIVLLDLGMVGELSPELRYALADLIYSVRDQDSQQIASVLLSMSVGNDDVDEKAFGQDVDRVVQRYMIHGDETSLQSVISAILGLLYARGLRLNQELTIALKALVQIEEAIATLSPSVSMVDIAMDEARQLLVEQLTFENVAETVRKQATRTVKELARRAPSLSDATLKWLDQYQSGRLSVHVDTTDLSRDLDKIRMDVRSVFDRVFIAVILAGLLVGSAIVSQLTEPIEILGISLTDLAGVAFVVSALFGLYFVASYVWEAFRRSLD